MSVITYICYECPLYHCDYMKLIGTSKVSTYNKTTIIEDVVKILNLKSSDSIAYLKSKSGNIVIMKLSDVDIMEQLEG